MIHGSGFAKKTSPFHIQSKIEFVEEGTLPDIRLTAFMIHINVFIIHIVFFDDFTRKLWVSQIIKYYCVSFTLYSEVTPPSIQKWIKQVQKRDFFVPYFSLSILNMAICRQVSITLLSPKMEKYEKKTCAWTCFTDFWMRIWTCFA